jgi:hypothetical protein
MDLHHGVNRPGDRFNKSRQVSPSSGGLVDARARLIEILLDYFVPSLRTRRAAGHRIQNSQPQYRDERDRQKLEPIHDRIAPRLSDGSGWCNWDASVTFYDADLRKRRNWFQVRAVPVFLNHIHSATYERLGDVMHKAAIRTLAASAALPFGEASQLQAVWRPIRSDLCSRRGGLRGEVPELLPAATSIEFANQIRLILAFLSQSALVNVIKQRPHMPHVGPIPEGRTFFCPHSGAFYSATPSLAPKSEGDPARCVVCLKIMDGLDVRSFKLIHRPEDT